jgi:hypothetical protein
MCAANHNAKMVLDIFVTYKIMNTLEIIAGGVKFQPLLCLKQLHFSKEKLG